MHNNPISVWINSALLCMLQNVKWSGNRVRPERKKQCFQLRLPSIAFLSFTWRTPPRPLSWGSYTRSHISRVCGSQGQCKEEAKIQPGGGRKEGNIPLAIGEKRNFPSSWPRSKFIGPWCSHFSPCAHTSLLLMFGPLVLSDSLRPHGLQHTRPPCPSPSPKVCPSSRPLHQRCHPAIASFNTLFSFCPQSSPASGTFPVNRPFESGGQNTGASTLSHVLPWFKSLQGLSWWSPG